MSDNESEPLAISEDLVQSPTHKPPTTTTLDFGGLLPTPLKLHEDLTEGCGGQLWPAGMVLAKYLLQHHKHTLQGKTILELGSGSGLVGLALALALGSVLPHPLLITDQSPMLPLMRRNIALNNLDHTVHAERLDWGAPLPAAVLANPPDVVLAADCVYFEPAFPLLRATLLELIGEGTVCWFCFKKRRRADAGFLRGLRGGLVVREVRGGVEGEEGDGGGRERVFLYEITRKK